MTNRIDSAVREAFLRALRYYESMGLIKSTRSKDYAYRLYDRQVIMRLELKKQQ
ncbi:MAG: hypothetical protein K2O91_17545 [Lachnospiraceae bacterium]|nr:hypothetical protein [Lachnospiraceae bacterium]